MRGKTRARDLASSRHHVDDSIRYLGLLQQLGEEQRAEWRLLGWLEDHAVAAGEGRRDLPHYLRPFRRRQLTPRAAIEGPAGGGNGAVDVLGTALSYASQHLASGGVDGLKSLAAGGLHPAPTNEELLGPALQKRRDLEVFGDRHGSILRVS